MPPKCSGAQWDVWICHMPGPSFEPFFRCVFGLCYLAPYVFECAGSPARSSGCPTLPARLQQQKAIWPPKRVQNQGLKQGRFHWPPLCHDCTGPLSCCWRAADKPWASLNQQACKNATPVAETKRKIPQKIASKFAKLNCKTAPVLGFKNWPRFGVRLKVCILAFNNSPWDGPQNGASFWTPKRGPFCNLILRIWMQFFVEFSAWFLLRALRSYMPVGWDWRMACRPPVSNNSMAPCNRGTVHASFKPLQTFSDCILNAARCVCLVSLFWNMSLSLSWNRCQSTQHSRRRFIAVI